MIAVEGFVLEHWEELSNLQDKKDYEAVSERFMMRILKLTEKNKGRLLKEIRERKDIMALLSQAQRKELDEPEKLQLRKYLIEVLKVIPAFGIISLPQRFLTLPVIMQILPRNFIAECLNN